MSAVTHLTARVLGRELANGSLTAAAVCESHLERVRSVEPRLSAFVTVSAELALERAKALDAHRAAGQPLGPLHGIPLALKDNLCTRGLPTTAASRILRGFVPPYDATVVARLEGAGAVVIGKTNLDEFAMGSSTENSSLGPTHNPWDLSRAPGGSSGGPSAAVAARLAPIAMRPEPGGPIRQPAGYCGIVGLKPTYGRVSRYGLLAFAPSLDQIGPFARTAEDAAMVLQALAGHDLHDATSSAERVPDYGSALT